jgi:uncharacterized protein YecE (DUF72 family)
LRVFRRELAGFPPLYTVMAGVVYIVHMAGLRVGTCSWKYPSWQGLVYSRATGIDYLAEYARKYSSVEIDQWFWTLPDPHIAAGYAGVTPDNFQFTIKLPNTLTLTHLRKTRGETHPRPNPEFLSPQLFEDVLDRLEPMRAKIGMLMLQFEYLNKQKMPSQADFLGRLGAFFEAVPRSLPCAIEPRNPQWLDQRYFDFLSEKELSHVFLQGYYMPPIVETYSKFGRLLRGAAVVRLHGPDREGIEQATGESWDRIVAPKDDELAGIIDMVRDMRDRSLTVYLNVNNHYEGSAPLTIERLWGKGLAKED